MGYGAYSLEAHEAITQARASKPREAVFQRNDCDPAMNPRGVRWRESRDSTAHPESVGIVFALDVSGSMEDIPHGLATRTLPRFMESVLPILPDAQVLVMAFGNAYADRSPLQVGQFESEAPLIDRWLAATHLEGGGGGLGESYDLAMTFASRHTAMDCLKKRGRKGYFFMTGDEVPFTHFSAAQGRALLDDGSEADVPIDEVCKELLRSFHAFFLIPDPARAARESCEAVWRKLLAERCVVLATPDDTAVAAAILIGITERVLRDREAIVRALEETFGRRGEERDRVLRAVFPYAEALARGPIRDPEPVQRRTDDPGLRG
jgi:hypothetical protein